MCGRMSYSMRDAGDVAVDLVEKCTARLFELGFQAGEATPCMLHHEQGEVIAYVQGFYFVVIGLPNVRKRAGQLLPVIALNLWFAVVWHHRCKKNRDPNKKKKRSSHFITICCFALGGNEFSVFRCLDCATR